MEVTVQLGSIPTGVNVTVRNNLNKNVDDLLKLFELDKNEFEVTLNNLIKTYKKQMEDAPGVFYGAFEKEYPKVMARHFYDYLEREYPSMANTVDAEMKLVFMEVVSEYFKEQNETK